MALSRNPEMSLRPSAMMPGVSLAPFRCASPPTAKGYDPANETVPMLLRLGLEENDVTSVPTPPYKRAGAAPVPIQIPAMEAPPLGAWNATPPPLFSDG